MASSPLLLTFYLSILVSLSIQTNPGMAVTLKREFFETAKDKLIASLMQEMQAFKFKDAKTSFNANVAIIEVGIADMQLTNLTFNPKKSMIRLTEEGPFLQLIDFGFNFTF